MPYRRHRRFRKYRKGGRKLNKTQKMQVKRIAKVPRELKYFSYTNTGTSSTTYGVVSISDIAQGDTDITRDGDQLYWCGTMEVRGVFENAQGSLGDLYNTFRMIIFQWHPNSTPVIGNILINGPSGAEDVHSTYSHDYRHMYKILFDKVITTIGPSYTNATLQQPTTSLTARNIHYRIPLKKIAKRVQFAGGGITATNKLYFALASDSSAATHPSWKLAFKLFYYDS